MNTVSKYDVADVVKHILGTSETDNAGNGGINGIFGAILAEISENSLEVNAEGKVAESGTAIPLSPSAEPEFTETETPTIDQLVANLNTRIFEERVSEVDLEAKKFPLESIGKDFDPSLNGLASVSDKIARGGVISGLSTGMIKEPTRNTHEVSNNKNHELKTLVNGDESGTDETVSYGVNNRQAEFESGSPLLTQKQNLSDAAFSRNENIPAAVGKSVNNDIDRNRIESQQNTRFKTTNYVETQSDTGQVKDESVRVETLREKRPVILGPANHVPTSTEIRSEQIEPGFSENGGDGYGPLKREIVNRDDFVPKNVEGMMFTPREIRQVEPDSVDMKSKNNSVKFDSDVYEPRSEQSAAKQIPLEKEKSFDGPKIFSNSVAGDPLKAQASRIPRPDEIAILSPIPRSGAVKGPSLEQPLSNVDDALVEENPLKSNAYRGNKFVKNDIVSSGKELPEEKLDIANKGRVSPGFSDVPEMKVSKKNQKFEYSDRAQMRLDELSIGKTISRSEYSEGALNNFVEDSGLNSVKPLAPTEGNQLISERNFNNGITANMDVKSHEVLEGTTLKSRTSNVSVSNFSNGMQAAVSGQLSQTPAGNSKFTVSLFPENFGKIEVEVTFSEDAGLNVKMFSDNPEATKLLQQNISTLRDSLAFEKVNELVIDSNREQNSDENFGNDPSDNQRLVEVDSESVLTEESSEEEEIDTSASSDLSEGLDTYV
ncbi:MAG: flagellar hook-length control protein FliK [Gammaproteobacteria bacterium]|nr:flagellar hook-length control protein FliK [Gammaproteobacteria bacterium]